MTGWVPDEFFDPMPLYQYTAIDDLGRTQRGRMEVSSEAGLDSLLRKQGQWLVKAQPRAGASPGQWGSKTNQAAPRRALIEFFLQVGLQLRCGISLVDALRFGLKQAHHRSFCAIQSDLLERVKAGSSFSEALAAHPRTFAPLVINLIRAGESSGRLTETCADIRRYYEWIDRLMADIRQALLYPVFVLVATIAFFFLVFTFLIPRFTAVLVEIQVKLPWPTRVLLGMSDFLKVHGWAVAAGLVLGGLVLRFGPRLSAGFARRLDGAKLKLPIFGPIQHLICLSRVAQNLATLYRAGIPLLPSLQLCRGLVGNRLIEEALDRVEDSVNVGRPLHEAMQDHHLFSDLMVQMVAVGEATGSLADSLQHVADYYNEVVPSQVKKLLSVMEPVMIVGLIVLVGLLALAIFLPIVSLFDAK